MFAILVPVALFPLIVTLFWAERKAKQLGLINAPRSKPDVELERVKIPVAQRAWTFAQQLDVVGLALIGTSTALILLPLTLAESAKGGWHNRECSRAARAACGVTVVVDACVCLFL